jgi:primosomal protein N' (replication factor Y) (superfamily II helicase)
MSKALKPPGYVDSLWEEYAQVDIADIVVDIDAPGLEASYSYRVPESLQNTLQVGACVHIPFSGRETLGYVIERRKLSAADPLCGKLKPIIAIVEDAITINSEQLQAVRFMSERYVCDLLGALRCVAPATLGARVATMVRLADPNLRGAQTGDSLPQAHIVETLRTLDGPVELETLRDAANLPNFAGAYAALQRKGMLIESREIMRAKTVGKTIKAYALGAAAEVLGGAGVGRRSPQQQRLLNELLARARRNEGPMPANELLAAAQAGAASLRGLLEKGLVQVTELTVWRAPLATPRLRTEPPILMRGQRDAVETLRECIDSRAPQTVLLFGVTASGKTEVYLQAIAHTLEQGRSAIVLVPEIALTAQVADVFVGRFGDQVAVLHSRISEGERHDEWRRMQAGQARIVVGARSAIFAPVQNVGLIVLDEEHEASYKQENTPRYNAKELAGERARLSNATLVLGSATPSLESYYASEQAKKGKENSQMTQMDANLPTPEHPNIQNPKSKIQNPKSPAILRIEMPERIDNRPLPHVTVIDLREEFKQRRALFAQRLVDEMAVRLGRKQQIILFLNRRGYAQFVLCRDCGWAARCPNCAVSLAFHSYDRSLKCHHCDYVGRAPSVCPDCGGGKVRAFGIGTEKVEEEVLNLFPKARVVRLDRDTTARKGAHSRIVRDFRQGEADILIGTQMVAKGLDFPNVTLVGVVSADTAINMPDFRAAERTFQLLTQVAGRSGRGKQAGEVIIQTFSPDHYAIQAAIRHDYKAFYKQEILFRQELKYPPFSRFANLICGDLDERAAQARAGSLAAALQQVVPQEVEVIGPSAAPLARLKNQFRFHVALRAPVDAPLSDLVRAALALIPPNERLGIHIDMDPLSMA